MQEKIKGDFLKMRRRILSLCLALSVLMSVAGVFPAVSSAENTDDGMYVNSDDILAHEQAENTDEELYTDYFSDILMFGETENISKTQEKEYETTVAYSDSNIQTLEQYDAQLNAIAGQAGSTDPMVLTENEEYVNVLLRRRLVDKTGYETLAAKMNEDADFAAAMEWLFSDIQMLRYYSYGGEPEANKVREKYKPVNSAIYMSSFDVLSQIYTKHKEDMNDSENAPLYKRMIAAIALTHSVPVLDWHCFSPYGNRYKWRHYSEPVGRYELYKKFYGFGFLAEEFEKYNVEEMRMVMSAPIDNAQLEWMQHYYRFKYLKNPDYATRVVQASRSNVWGWCNMAYAVQDKDAVALGSKPLYMPENYDKWNEKYMLSVHDDYFDFDVDYGLNENGQYYEQQWITIERGGVCFDTSFTACIVRNAFGLASRYLYQAPDHVSFMPYDLVDGNPICGNGYNVYGMPNSGIMFYGYSHAPAGWSNYQFAGLVNAGYMFLGIDAIYNNHDAEHAATDYEKAENLAYLAEIQVAKENYEGALALYEKAIEAQYFHLESYVGIANIYEKLGKTSDDYKEFAVRITEAFKWYPQVVYDFIFNYLYKKLDNDFQKAEIIGLVYDTLTVGMGANAQNSRLYQPSYCVQIASSLRNKLPKLASFSFDTGAITLNASFRNTGKNFLYSFDKGATWNTWEYEAGAASHVLTPEEISKITDANDIYYKFDTSDYVNVIAIGTQAIPASNVSVNTLNDDEDKFLNLQKGLEYSTDEGKTWQDLTDACIFEGNVTVWVRKKTAGVYLAGPHFVANFTVADDTPERRYLKIGGNVNIVKSPEAMGDGPVSNAIDGKKNTYWIKQYMTTGRENGKPAWNDEFIFEIGEPHYISGIGYIPALLPANVTLDGTIKKCEVWISNDKENWQLAGSTESWAYIKGQTEDYPREQYINFDEPAYTKYVKIKVVEAGIYPVLNLDRGYATAAEFKLYENVLCPDKEVSELSVTVDSEKAAYKVGDRLDLDSLTARVVYTDGTTSIIPASELEYSEDVFNSTDTKKVKASYNGIETSFDVTVEANDRIATAISSVTVSERKYYAGDTFDKSNALVKVTDGTESWYLLPNEFELGNGVLAEGNHTITAVHNELSKDFTVNTEKAVREIRIDTDESFKNQYFIGDEMDLTGMSVKLVYADDTETELAASEYDMNLTKDGNVPITEDIFARTAGTKTITASLKDKSEVSGSLDVTVFAYITSGEFSFEAMPGETSCRLTAFTPTGDLSGRTVEIPETIEVGGYTYTVTEIARGAFNSAAAIEAVSIPKSVETIYAQAFESCTELKRVYMTDYKSFDGFTCEDGAFEEVQDGYVYLNNSLANSASPIEGYTVASIAQTATSITVTPPAKTEYILGDEFDKTGMTVTAVLPDGSKVNTNAYSMRGFYSTITGEQTITITLDGSKLKQTFTVNVSFPKITIAQSPLSAAYVSENSIKPISVKAAAENNNELQYQWYRSDTEEKNGTAIVGAKKAQYTPTEAGYYYAAVYVRDKNNKDSEPVYSDAANITVGNYEAIVGTTGYSTLKEAVDNAPDDATILICKDIEVNDVISLAGKKLTIDGQGHTIKRADDFKKTFMLLTEQAAVTLTNITFDGGAVWTGDEDSIVKRGLTNSGLTATAPFIIAYSNSEVVLLDGAVMQNNYNTGKNANNNNTILDNDLTGGAIWTIDSTLTLNGGIIQNNASTLFGSAVYMRGASVLTSYKGEVTGHHAPTPSNRTTAICTDNNTTVNIQNGTFSNNKGGDQGGVFWIGHGTMIIKGGTFENNYSSGSGGVAFFSPTGNAATLTLTGGTFRNNTSAGNGGVFCCGKAAAISGAVFENNTAVNGGAIAINNGAATSSNNEFINNKAINGGAVWAQNTVTTNNDIFVGNTADKGDGMYFSGSRQLNVGNVGTVQDIYFETFKRITITGANANENKYLSLVTDDDIATGTEIALVNYAVPMDIRINGYKTEKDSTDERILKAVITPRVKYNKDGGSIDNEGSYTVYNEGTSLTLPVPTKDGYNFAGWYDNAELTGSAVTEIGTTETGDKEYWAKWETADYTVTLNVNGGVLSNNLTVYNFGTGAALPVPSKDGYNFAGWFDNAECEGAVVTEITDKDFGNKEYWAKWAKNGYSVTLNTNGGTLAENLTEYTYGEGAVLPVPTRDNYTFEGWFDNADCEGAAVTEIGAKEMGNKAYWAKWKINEYVIRFVNYNDRLLQKVSVEFGKRPEYTGAVPEKDADDRYTYTFNGWSPEITSVTGDTTYKAQFESAPRVYSLMLNLDGGIVDNEEAYMEYTCGTGVALPTPYKDDFYFVGWYDNENYSGEPVNAVTADDFGDKAFWAKWTQDAPPAFTITFVNYDNTTLQSESVTIGTIPDYHGSEPTRESDDKYSYRFIGWDKEFAEVTEMATYTAQFERTPINSFVEYMEDGNALIGSPESGEYDVIFAAYDSHDKLIGVEKVHKELSDEIKETIVEPQSFSTDGAAKVKVMLWKSIDSMTPKCGAAVKLITNN